MISLKRLISLASSAMLLCFMVTTAWAETCGGENLLAKLKDEKPGVYVQIANKAAETPNGQALLWRIEGNGAAEPSFLFGTMHVTDKRVATLNTALLEVLDNVNTVALEIEGAGDKTALQAELAKRPDLMVLQGTSLWDLIDDGVEQAIVEELKNVGIPKAAAAQLQPWLPAMALSSSLCETQRLNSGHPVLDGAIESYAKEKGHRIVGLETAIEQFSIMSSMPIAAQALFLTDAARMRKYADDMNETLIQLYLQRRITWFMPFSRTLTEQTAERKAAENSFLGALIDKRNANMAERARSLLTEGRVLMAVGALHLPGEKGLVELFRQQGFEVTAID